MEKARRDSTDDLLKKEGETNEERFWLRKRITQLNMKEKETAFKKTSGYLKPQNNIKSEVDS